MQYFGICFRITQPPVLIHSQHSLIRGIDTYICQPGHLSALRYVVALRQLLFRGFPSLV